MDKSFFLLAAVFLLSACAPRFEMPMSDAAEPRLTDTELISFDGSSLPLRVWKPGDPPEAVLIALHGFNDYSEFITSPAEWFSERGILVYAYDQRGFGRTPERGRWSGHKAMCRDLRTMIDLVRKERPGVPVYLLGESMGGAVIMAAENQQNPLPVNGIVLVAPAVWSRNTMPFYQKWLLELAVRIMPGLHLTGKGLNVTPSDNREMLRALGRDRLVIKKTRVDSIYGLVDLMDAANSAAARFNGNALFLYGAKDDIIPPASMADVFDKRLSGDSSVSQRLLVYDNGYHMLLRDLQAEVVWGDILLWLTSPQAPFPSVEDRLAREITDPAELSVLLSSG